MAFIHAYRAGGGDPTIVESAVSGSKFSRGDIVLTDVGSTVSKNSPVAQAADIFGIALADSDQSINGLIPVLLPEANDVFLADSAAGTVFVRGVEHAIATSSASRHIVAASTTTAKVVIVKSTTKVLGQSNRSAVLCKFIYHTGLIDLS